MDEPGMACTARCCTLSIHYVWLVALALHAFFPLQERQKLRS